jgi:long-chain fatty acid transport protein
MKKLLTSVCMVFLCLAAAPAVFATNGMNLEGYGPIATGMGGASMAYDNGTAAVMNNPATLGLMSQGDRLDVALGYLGPHVKASVSGIPNAKSSADAFFMPAVGWVRKAGSLSYGIGLFSQGGMGTEFDALSFVANPNPLVPTYEKVRSEVGVGRVLIPLAYEVNKDLSLGGTVDFVWASMDLKMALSGGDFLNMAGMTPTPYQFGIVTGTMLDAFGGFVAGGIINPADPVNWGRFDFSDDSAFTGKAKGNGIGGKVGGVYRVAKNLSIGLAYHSKTSLSDLKADGANVTFNANIDTGIAAGGPPSGTYAPMAIPLRGKITVKDFEWPQMIATGIAYKPTNSLLLVFDYKWINWAAVMKNFKMNFTADTAQPGLASGFAGTSLDARMFQNWKNQNVFMLGAGYRVTPAFTARIGANIANNPIPDMYLNPLFPATVKNHYMIGAGYVLNVISTIDASFTYAPEVHNTITGSPVTVSHRQTNGQIMYSYRF